MSGPDGKSKYEGPSNRFFNHHLREIAKHYANGYEPTGRKIADLDDKATLHFQHLQDVRDKHGASVGKFLPSPAPVLVYKFPAPGPLSPQEQKKAKDNEDALVAQGEGFRFFLQKIVDQAENDAACREDSRFDVFLKPNGGWQGRNMCRLIRNGSFGSPKAEYVVEIAEKRGEHRQPGVSVSSIDGSAKIGVALEKHGKEAFSSRAIALEHIDRYFHGTWVDSLGGATCKDIGDFRFRGRKVENVVGFASVLLELAVQAHGERTGTQQTATLKTATDKTSKTATFSDAPFELRVLVLHNKAYLAYLKPPKSSLRLQLADAAGKFSSNADDKNDDYLYLWDAESGWLLEEKAGGTVVVGLGASSGDEVRRQRPVNGDGASDALPFAFFKKEVDFAIENIPVLLHGVQAPFGVVDFFLQRCSTENGLSSAGSGPQSSAGGGENKFTLSRRDRSRSRSPRRQDGGNSGSGQGQEGPVHGAASSLLRLVEIQSLCKPTICSKTHRRCPRVGHGYIVQDVLVHNPGRAIEALLDR